MGYQMKRFFFLITFVALSLMGSYAQDNSIKQLVITEVYLDSKNQEFWIEVFNPTDEELTSE